MSTRSATPATVDHLRKPTVSSRLVLPFVAVTEELGFPGAPGLKGAGFRRQMLDEPDTRLSWPTIQGVLRTAVQWTGRPGLGLLAAERVEPGLFDLVEFAARSQTTLKGAIDSLQRLFPLLFDAAEIRLLDRGDMVALKFVCPRGYPCEPAAVDFALACLQIEARRITGLSELTVSEVTFVHEAPADVTPYERIFRAPLRFGADENSLVFPSEHLALPLVFADSKLCETLQRIGEQFVRSLPTATTLRETVQNEIARQLAEGECTCETIAGALGVTPRTLHRRLKDEGTTFRDELDAMRYQLATTYLKEGALSVTDLAYLLGFSTVASFYRAFKRWTGTTPREFRSRE